MVPYLTEAVKNPLTAIASVYPASPAKAAMQTSLYKLSLLHILSGGQLRIAASDTICRYFLVPYFNKFHSASPGIHIKVTNSTSIDLSLINI